jgi:hypothetical protein
LTSGESERESGNLIEKDRDEIGCEK